MSATMVFCYPPIAKCVQCVLEFPKGVALEIKAYNILTICARNHCVAFQCGKQTNKPLLAPGKAHHLPLVPCLANWPWSGCHCEFGVDADNFWRREGEGDAQIGDVGKWLVLTSIPPPTAKSISCEQACDSCIPRHNSTILLWHRLFFAGANILPYLITVGLPYSQDQQPRVRNTNSLICAQPPTCPIWRP